MDDAPLPLRILAPRALVVAAALQGEAALGERFPSGRDEPEMDELLVERAGNF